jgi:small-conductance mechanosensitive channel
MRIASILRKLVLTLFKEIIMTEKQKKTRFIIGEVLSQLLNVPLLSGALATFLYFRLPATEPHALSGYLWVMLFLCVIPSCSLFFYIPGRDEERQSTLHRQRVASFIFMIVSYPIGWLVLSLTHAPRIFTATTATYTFVTLGLIFFNLLLHYKASGHAAGVSGPVASMIYIFGIWATPLLLLLPLVTWARLAAKGHNLWQTVVGATMSSVIAIVVLWVFGFAPFSGMVW